MGATLRHQATAALVVEYGLAFLLVYTTCDTGVPDLAKLACFTITWDKCVLTHVAWATVVSTIPIQRQTVVE